MADNVEAASGSGGPVFKTDEDTGASAHVPVTKIELGANGTFSGYVCDTLPMPCKVGDGTNYLTVIATHADDTVNTTNAIPVGAFLYVFDGTAWDRLKGDSTDGVLVNLGSNNDVTVTGTVTVDCNSSNVTVANASIAVTSASALDCSGATITVTATNLSCDMAQYGGSAVGASNAVHVQPGTGAVFQVQSNSANLATETTAAAIQTAVEVIDDWDDGSDRCRVVGAAAENAAVAGNPVLAGGRYDSTARTLDNGDVGAMALSAAGEVIAIPQAQYVMHGSERCQVQHFHVVTSTTGATIIAAPGAGKRLKILSMTVIALSTTATNVHFETGTTNTDCFGDSTNPIPIAVDADGDNHGGLVLNWNPGGWFITADSNESMEVVLSAAQNILVCGNYIAYTA